LKRATGDGGGVRVAQAEVGSSSVTVVRATGADNYAIKGAFSLLLVVYHKYQALL
jgi:hypothetical protein